jgi:hypothetical protein
MDIRKLLEQPGHEQDQVPPLYANLSPHNMDNL